MTTPKAQTWTIGPDGRPTMPHWRELEKPTGPAMPNLPDLTREEWEAEGRSLRERYVNGDESE